LIGIALGLERRNFLAASISIGILFYLAFVLSIGGDFMAGRFFTAPLLMATIQIARLTMGSRAALVAIMAVVSLGFFNINQTILSGATYSNAVITKTGISDERGVYFQGHGLITGKSDGVFSMRDWSIGVKGVEVTCGGLGFKSLYRGPSTHYIDTCALTDPLLARIPALSTRQRIGHFNRALPAGYTESVAYQKNLVIDVPTKNFYDAIRLITRGDLNDIDRLKRIVSMNLSLFRNASGMTSSTYRYPLALNETTYFKKNSKGSFFLQEGASHELLTNGWSSPEDWGVWAIGSVARLSLPIPVFERPKALYLDMQILVPPAKKYQTVEVYKVVGGSAADGYYRFYNGSNKVVEILNIAATEGSILSGARITIPIEQFMIDEGNVSIEFRFPTPVRPRDVNLNSDDRELTMGLISAVFR
jgi:hypothetical protein